MAKVTAKLNGLRVSPRKAGLLTKFVKGKDVDEAIAQLSRLVKGKSPEMKKLLESAVANGENNFGFDRTNLFVEEAVAEAGPVLKRWMPKAFGRAGRILKRTSNIKVVLAERVEGKGRKSKEQMEEDRRKRMEEKKKLQKETEKEADKEAKKDEKGTKEGEKIPTKEKKDEEKAKKGSGKGNWTSRIFRRKSM